MPDDISRDQFIPPPGTSEADRRRQSFGAQADAYTKFRPGYPPEVLLTGPAIRQTSWTSARGRVS